MTISGGGHSGVFQVDSGVTASLSGLTITGGVANQGGGLDNYGTAMLTDCTISGNSANGGGGLDNNRHAVMTLTGCTISGNSAETGGGVNIESPDPSLFADNTATFTDCTISGNSAEAGGGVYLAFGTATFTDCTISSNSVSLFGGGLNSIGAATLTDCTLSGNSASLLGGGLNSEFGTVTIGDTIVAGNTAATEPDVDGAISTDQGYNLIGNTAGSSGLTASTDRLNRAAALAPLGDYGGPTQTMALLPGSPAIGKGAALGQTTDQRGFPLDSPTPDIGAFQTNPLTVNTTLDGAGSPSGDLSLRQAVNLANVLGAAEMVTFGPTAFAQAQTITLTRGQLVLKDTGGAETITGPAAGLTIGGGGHSRVFQIDNGVTASLSGLTITGGSGSSYPRGGGLFNEGTVTLTGCTISGNSASYGAGVYNAGTVTLTGCTVSGNSARYFGGGLDDVGTATLTDCTISGNSAAGGGGLGGEFGMVTLTDCTISGNSAESGGGVTNEFGNTASLTDCTLSGNFASVDGGGVDNILVATLTLTGCTVSGNSAGSGGGGVDNLANLTIGDTIVAGNTAANGPDVDGAISTDQGYNLIGNTAGSSGLTASTDQLNQAAALAPLGDYGGPTQTMALLPGSPAIGKGAALGQTTDQRGFPLDSPIPDIGAFESQGFTIAVAGGNSQSAFFNTAFSQPLAVTVTPNNPVEPVDGGVVTFTAPSSGASATLSAGTATIAGGQAFVTATAGATAGSYTVTASASGSPGATFSLTNVPAPITISPSSLANATAGNSYSQYLTASGAVGGPFSFAVTAGALPSGFTLAPDGTLSGTSTLAGMATFTVTATGAGGYAGSLAYSLTVDPTVTSNFVVTGFPSPTTAGVSGSFTVTARDVYGNVTPNYSGTVNFASSDGQAVLPAGSTLTNGTGSFSATFKTAGTQSITASNGFITGTQTGILVSPGTAAMLNVVRQPAATATAGQVFATQPAIDELDAYGNLETGDSTSTVTVASTGTAALQGPTTFTLAGGVATFGGLSYDKAETITLQFTTSAGSFSATSAHVAVSAAAPAALVIVTQPSSTATAGQAFVTQPVVDELDAFGNLETGDSTHTVTAASTGTASLQGTTTVTLSGGVASFSGLFYDKAETITLQFTTSTGGFSATSANVAVSPAAPAALVIVTQPSSTAMAGQVFATQPVIDELDLYGNLETGDSTHTVTVASTGTAGLQGPTTVTLAGGVANFSGLSYDKAETITLQFTTSAGGFSATSANVAVSPAATSQFLVASFPSPVSAGTAGSFAVTAEDAYGNTTPSYTGTVKFSSSDGQAALPANTKLTSGTGSFNATLKTAGSRSITATDTLTATITGSQSGIAVNPSSPASLVIATQPSSTATAGQKFATQPVIDELDAYGNLETGDSTHTVTAASTGTASLQGPTTVTLAGGVASFGGLSYNKAETITIQFTTSAGGFSATSAHVAVSPAAPAALVIVTQPPSTATAGQKFTTQPAIDELDAYGNLETGDSTHTVTAASTGTASLQGTTTITLAGGVASFSGLSYNKAETITIQFTASAGGFSVTSGKVAVSPALTSQFLVAGFPSPVTAGTAGSFTVTAKDAYGNTTPSYTGTVKFSSSDGQAALPANTKLTSGTGSFNATLKTAGSRSITATDTVTTTITGSQSGIAVNPSSPASLAIVTQPSSTATAGQKFATQPVIDELDAYGNLETGDSTHTVTAASTGTASLQGTTTIPLAGGVANFSGLFYDKAETITIKFTTSAGSFTATSGNVAVSPAATSQFVVAGFPSPVTAGTAGSFTVTAEDAYGNTTPAYTGTVKFTSSDGQAVLPANAKLTNGTGSFKATLKTAGSQSITATDTVSGGITGSQSGITVNPAAATTLSISAPTSVTSGTPFTITVTALDPYNNVATGYRGTVHFTSSDSQASLPNDYPFTATDNGAHTFTNGVTLKKKGTQTITATDKATKSITGSVSISVAPRRT